MKKLLLVLAIGAFAACNETTTEETTTVDTTTVAPVIGDTAVVAPVDTTAAAADTSAAKSSFFSYGTQSLEAVLFPGWLFLFAGRWGQYGQSGSIHHIVPVRSEA